MTTTSSEYAKETNDAKPADQVEYWLPPKPGILYGISNDYIVWLIISILFLILAVFTGQRFDELDGGQEYGWLGVVWVTVGATSMGYLLEQWGSEVKAIRRRWDSAASLSNKLENILRLESMQWQKTLNAILLVIKDEQDKQNLSNLRYFVVATQLSVRDAIESHALQLSELGIPGFQKDDFIKFHEGEFIKLRKVSTKAAVTSIAQDDPNLERVLQNIVDDVAGFITVSTE